ncbi:DUF624 domain-containing protein [Halalkalibacter sp. AB-rgal2]|uniref:DUF624 domain-containing protein n=1 Tax=Halalkalibacter sp. AB-rgal2 TaxID=3242695 RepID=UPI00359E430F
MMDMTFITRVYYYIQASLLFWLFVLRGFVVYGLIPATAGLFAVIADVKRGRMDEEDVSIAQMYTSYYRMYSTYKWGSFLFALVFALLYMTTFLLNESTTEYSLIGLIVMLYLLALFLLLFTYTSYLITEGKVLFLHQTVGISFVLAIKNLLRSVFLLVGMFFLYYMGTLNLLVFAVSAPALYGIMVRALMTNLNK